jgi:hypothetical protein
MQVDNGLHDPITDTVRVTGSTLPPSVPDHEEGYDGPLLPAPGEHRVGVVYQYSPHSSSFTTGSRDVSSIGEWDASNITNSIPGYEDWLMTSNNEFPHAQSFHGNQNTGLEDFKFSTMNSMALNNAALDADLSTYSNSYAPGHRYRIQEDHVQHSTRTPVALPESTSLPIEASALNVGIAIPQSPEVLSRMPSLLKESPRRTLALPIIDEDTYYAIMAGIKDFMTVSAEMDPLLSLQDMQQFMKCYLVCFHRHCPVIHLPSLDLRVTPGLVLTMCAIGALYRLRRKTAHDLWQCAQNICEKVLVMKSRTSSVVY